MLPAPPDLLSPFPLIVLNFSGEDDGGSGVLSNGFRRDHSRDDEAVMKYPQQLCLKGAGFAPWFVFLFVPVFGLVALLFVALIGVLFFTNSVARSSWGIMLGWAAVCWLVYSFIIWVVLSIFCRVCQLVIQWLRALRKQG